MGARLTPDAVNRTVDRLSVIVIAISAALWATDAYFRAPLVAHLSAADIVLAEGVILTLILSPFIWWRRQELRGLGGRAWLAVIVIAVGPQAIATTLFTASFAYHDFAVTYVLQQTQPIVSIILAGILLGERRRAAFWPVVVIAIAGVYLVYFAPDLRGPFASQPAGRVQAGLLALGAAALWGLGTVLGRYLTGRLSTPTLTGLRVSLSVPVLLALVLTTEGFAFLSHYRLGDARDLAGLVLIPDLLPLLLYYRALRATPASLSTIAEMAYPVTATLIASAPVPFGFGQAIYPAQVVGTLLLLLAIGLANWNKVAGIVRTRPAPPLGTEEAARAS